MPDQGWIVIPRWRDGKDGFQHYGDRDPKWIKNYTRLLHNDAYLRLSGHRRGLLHGLWLAYAMSGGCVAVDPQMLGRQLGLVVKMADIESLNHAGFIEFSASAPGLDDASPEKRRVEKSREEKKDPFSADIQVIYDYWRERRNKTRANYETISDGRRAKIRSRLREFTVADLKAAIDGVAKDPWADRALHDDITVIFRSREQVERFLEMGGHTNGHANGFDPDAFRARIEAMDSRDWSDA